jgi:hypothetical protein
MAAGNTLAKLKVFLLGQSDAPYAALAREMNTSEGALKVSVHRLRKRYRELFRQEIADTVADPAEVESELRFLAAALSKKQHFRARSTFPTCPIRLVVTNPEIGNGERRYRKVVV